MANVIVRILGVVAGAAQEKRVTRRVQNAKKRCALAIAQVASVIAAAPVNK